MLKKVACIIILSTLMAQAVAALDSETRPKTCLVLSGGGARGAAHVGVLKVLRENRVPIDCIVGTSMGAVVGGLYAAGATPGELDVIFEESDWRDLLNDRPPRKHIPFRRKQDDNLSLFQFEFGVGRKGIVLPTGLIAGQKLNYALNAVTINAAAVRDFDDLPIPFRAVATDISTGEEVVLREGILADAMRASMAVPGAFTPVVKEGKTLVDGGLVRNLPVSVARQMGAERVIAVDVAAPLTEMKPGWTVVEVTQQMLNLLTERNIREQKALLGEQDLLIVPDLSEIGSAAFELVPAAVDLGEEAARRHQAELQRFSVSQEAYDAYLADRRHRKIETRRPITLDQVAVTGVQRVNPRIIISKLKTTPGEILNMEILQNDLERVYELGDFERVDFKLAEVADEHILLIDAKEKSWGPNFLRFGLGLEADFEGQGEFTVLADLTMSRVNRLGAEWKNRVSIGEENSIFSEFYQPLGYSGFWFIAPRVLLSRKTEDVYDPNGTFTPYKLNSGLGGFDLGVQFRRYGELRLGVEGGRITARTDIPDAPIDELEVDIWGWRGSLTMDQLDNANFPRRGTFFEGELYLARESLGSDNRYDRLELFAVRAGSFGKNTIVAAARYGTGLDTDIPFYHEFELGGFLNLSGYKPGRLRGQVLAFGQLAYFREVGQLPGGLGEGVYLGLSLEVGNTWLSSDTVELSDMRAAAALFGGLDTIFGPLYVGYGRADGKENSFYLFLGRSF